MVERAIPVVESLAELDHLGRLLVLNDVLDGNSEIVESIDDVTVVVWPELIGRIRFVVDQL
jgi:hypothetical protein